MRYGSADRFNVYFPDTTLFKKAIFFILGNLLILISRRKASLLFMSTLVASKATGLLDRVYLEAIPRL